MKQETKPTVDIKLHGIDMTLVFADREEIHIKERILDILSDAYEKRRLKENFVK